MIFFIYILVFSTSASASGVGCRSQLRSTSIGHMPEFNRYLDRQDRFQGTPEFELALQALSNTLSTLPVLKEKMPLKDRILSAVKGRFANSLDGYEKMNTGSLQGYVKAQRIEKKDGTHGVVLQIDQLAYIDSEGLRIPDEHRFMGQSVALSRVTAAIAVFANSLLSQEGDPTEVVQIKFATVNEWLKNTMEKRGFLATRKPFPGVSEGLGEGYKYWELELTVTK